MRSANDSAYSPTGASSDYHGEPTAFDFRNHVNSSSVERHHIVQSYNTKETTFVEKHSDFDPDTLPREQFAGGGSSMHMVTVSHQAELATPVGASGGSGTDIARQHYEWAQELESVDQKQADLVVLQWKLVRNQTGMLAQQLVDVRRQIEALEKNNVTITTHVETVTRDSESFEQRIKGFVRQFFDRLEQNFTKLKQDVGAESQRRDEGMSEFSRRLDQMTEEVHIAVGNKGMATEVNRLRSEMNMVQQHIPALKDHIQQSADELKSAYDQLLEHHRKVSERVDWVDRERAQAHDDLHTHVRGLVEKERIDRDARHGKVLTHLGNLQNELAAHREELPQIRDRVRDIEEKAMGPSKELMAQIEAKLAEPTQRIKETERRIEHISASIQQESVARHSLAEVFEQMLKTERTKITNLVNQKAAFSKLDCEELGKSLHERLDKERVERETFTESLQTSHTRHKQTIQDRVAVIEKNGSEGKIQEFSAEIRNIEFGQRKLEDQVLNLLRDTRKELQASIAEERTERERADALLEEQVDWVSDYYDKMKDVLHQKGHRKMLALRTPTSSRPPAVSYGGATPASTYGGATHTHYERTITTNTQVSSPASTMGGLGDTQRYTVETTARSYGGASSRATSPGGTGP